MSAAQPQGLDTATGAAAANTSGRRGMGRMVPHASSGTAHHEDDLDSSTAGAVTVVAAAVNDRPPTGASTRVRRMRSHRSSGREEYSGDYWKKHHDGTRTHPVLQHLFGLSAIANHSTSKRTWERDELNEKNQSWLSMILEYDCTMNFCRCSFTAPYKSYTLNIFPVVFPGFSGTDRFCLSYWQFMIRNHDTLAPFLAPHDPGRGHTFYASMLLTKYAACVAAGTALYVRAKKKKEKKKKKKRNVFEYREREIMNAICGSTDKEIHN